MRERMAVGIWMLIAGSVGTTLPVVARAQPSVESEISCDTPDALQHELTTIAAGGRIIIRSGTCTGNFTISRDVRIQGSGFDQVALRAADPALPVVTVPRGATATISGVTIAGGRIGILVTGRASLAFTMVSDNLSGIEIRDNGTFEADKLRVSRNKGPGLTVIKAEAAIRGGLINHNFSNGEGGGGVLVVGGRVELTGTQIEENDTIRDGGGVLALQKSAIILDRVRFFRNTARTGHGGAIAVNGSTAEMTGSSIFENVAEAGNGGGVAALNGSDIAVSNTTLAANVASFQFADRSGGWGGGVYVDKASKASLAYATIVHNTARFAAGVASNNAVTILASLLSGNLGASKAGECGGTGRIESKGWNLLMELGDCRFVSRAGDLMGASPRLGPPGLYGGAWNTVPLRDGSPAIDRIPLAVCSGGLDQRLKPRPARGGCDVGAFERQPDDVMP
jgi:predicted outer membrane repeat protein